MDGMAARQDPSPVARGAIRTLADRMRAAALLAGLLAGCAVQAASAEDLTTRTSIAIRVGETRSLGTFGGHRMDCVTNVPAIVDVTQPPRLGVLSQREGVAYVARDSISGTCLGARFLGTAVDYTARSPGVETVAFDLVFRNGRQHRIVTVTAAP